MEYLGGGQLKQLYEKRLEILKKTVPRKGKKPAPASPGKAAKKKSLDDTLAMQDLATSSVESDSSCYAEA